MGLSNKQPSTKEWKDDWRLEFWDNSYGGGYSFEGEVDSEGRFTLNPLENEFARENFLSALERAAEGVWKTTGVQETGTRRWDRIEIINCGWWVKTPARGTCECGEEVWLERDYGHGIDCEGCDRIYNQSGDRLAPRSQWEDHYDEDSVQPYCVEMGYIGPGDEY